MPPSRPRPPRPQLPSMMNSLPIDKLKPILSHIAPNTTLGPIKDIKSTQLARLYNLTMSDNRQLMLSFSPSLAVRLLRHEVTNLTSEATLVYFIQESQRRQETFGPTPGEEIDHSDPISLLELVPKLLKHSSNNTEMAYPYSIFEAVPGSPVSMLSTSLAASERKLLDTQIGIMARSLASLTSPGNFGQVSKVLPDPFKPAAPAVTGSGIWSEAFNILLEGILRDSEDMSISLPYEDIRRHYERHSWLLDEVTTPRLTLLDLGNDANVMIERTPNPNPNSATNPMIEDVRLTGLRSWSLGIFGDPLIADCFDTPSPEFMAGWGKSADNIIEDQENAEVRMLLYGVFRSVVGIAMEHYRGQVDSGKRELESRRKLTSLLKKLEEVSEVADGCRKRSRSPSGELGAKDVKRQKYSEGS